MRRDVYRYTFAEEVPIDEVEHSLVLAILATESLHGESQVRLDAAHFLDADRKVCVIEFGTAVGRDLNKLFIGFLRREFGEEAFQVHRVAGAENEVVAEAAA